MPQFDTFTFLSQITWVFFLFAIIYLSISYSLSPITATILKVRKLKFLDIKKTDVFSSENSIQKSTDLHSTQQSSLLNSIVSLKSIGFSLWNFKWNFKLDIYSNFFSKSFLVENLFLKNKFKYNLLRLIFSL